MSYPKKKRKRIKRIRTVKCPHPNCGILFEEKNFADDINLNICPGCGKPLPRYKMLKSYYQRQAKAPKLCPYCKTAYNIKNIDKNGELYCKNPNCESVKKGKPILKIGKISSFGV